MTEFTSIIYEVDKGKARITLTRPKKLNALSLKLQSELNEALWEADNNTAVHCVVLRGAGRAFSAGYDLTGTDHDVPISRIQSSENRYRSGSTIDDDAWQLERAQRYRMAIFDMHKPVICGIHGYCLAGGTNIVLMCDMIIAADDTLIGFPPSRDLGALPNNMWIYHVSTQWAKRLNLTGDMITGKEAQQIGLVMKSVPAEHLDYEIEQLADRLTLIDPDLLATNKRIINMALELMGARTLQRMASENDVRGHNTRAGGGFRKSVQEKGLKDTLRARDAKFGDGRVRVNGPEFRDDEGRLTDHL